MESPRDQKLINTIILVQHLLWWPENSIQQSANFIFCHIFQTVKNLQIGTTEMSSGGPKMVERSYGGGGGGGGGNGLKWPEKQEITGDPRWWPPPLRRPDSGASGGGFTVGFVWRSPPPCLECVAGGRPVLPLLVQTPTAHKWSKMVQLGFTILEGFS